MLEKENIVVEILENVKPTDEILSYLKELKDKDYILVLDDVVINYRYKEFGTLIDVYKIHFMEMTRVEGVIILGDIRRINLQGQLLVEKIETKEGYEEVFKIKLGSVI